MVIFGIILYSMGLIGLGWFIGVKIERNMNAKVEKFTSTNKQSTPCVTCGASVPLSTVSCMECINP